MKPSLLTFTTLVLVTFLLIGCDDFFEKNLSKKAVVVLAPANGVTVSEGNVTFSWRSLEGARSYQLIIVSPAFEAASRLIADTTLTGMQFTVRLTDGAYQWYVIPRNSAYEGQSEIFDLRVVKDQ